MFLSHHSLLVETLEGSHDLPLFYPFEGYTNISDCEYSELKVDVELTICTAYLTILWSL
jgi:hypothetical protein